jgi:NAD+ kinase
MAKVVGIVHHHSKSAAKTLAQQILEALSRNDASGWVCGAGEESVLEERAPDSDLVFSIGGDGTLLRVARAVAPHNLPIVGVNLGRLGFTTEVAADDVLEKLPQFLGGGAWVDERAMLQVTVFSAEGKVSSGSVVHALNDVVISRGAVSRTISIEARIEGELLTTYRADGIILCTATGSTAYNLALGGPILYPQAREMILSPIAAHLSPPYPLILSPTATVELQIGTDHEATLSADGQRNVAVGDGYVVRVVVSHHVTRLLRLSSPFNAYGTLMQRLRRSVGSP